MNVDNALEALDRNGKPGFWQLLIYIMVGFYMTMPGTLNLYTYIYAGATPKKYNCKIDNGSTLNDSVPMEYMNGGWRYSQCTEYANKSNTENITTIPCSKGWDYESDFGENTITEWNLVCGREKLFSLSTSLFFLFNILGALVFPILSDRCGRRPVFFIATISMCAVSALTAITPNVEVFLVMRLLSGIFQQGSILSGFIICSEIFATKHRTVAGLFLQNFWGLAVMTVAVIAWAVRKWRHLYLCISLPFFTVIFILWLVPESLPWLISKKKWTLAEKVFQKIAKCNKVAVKNLEYYLKEDTNAEESDKSNSVTRHTLVVISTNRTLRRWSVTMFIIWFTTSMSYYLVVDNSITIKGINPYLALLISSASDIVGYTVVIPVVIKCGRRFSLIIYLLLTSCLTLILSLITPAGISQFISTGLLVTLLWLARFFAGALFSIVYLITVELYPTMARNTGLGICSSGARLGSAAAPFIAYIKINKIMLNFPLALCAVMCVLCCVLAMTVPETKDRPLPHSEKDLEDLADDIAAPLKCFRWKRLHSGSSNLTSSEAEAKEAFI